MARSVNNASKAVPHGTDQVLVPADVEEGLLLSGEGGIRQVLRGGAGTHGHVGGFLTVLLAHFIVALE